MKNKPIAHIAWIILTSLALVGGIVFLTFALLPFSTLKSFVDSLAADRQMESFTLALYQSIRPFIGAFGAVMLAAGALSIAARRPIHIWLERLFDWLSKLSRKLISDSNQIWRALGSQFSDKKYLAALIGILLIASAIRLAYLMTPIRYDEAYTFLVFAMRPLRFIVSDYHVPNNHIFHTLLVRTTYLLFGSQLWAIRLPVFLAGILLVPVTYLTGKIFFERRTALLSAALVAASSILIEYSTNARGYMFISLFGLLILNLAVYLKTHDNLAAWTLLVIFSAMGFYTVPVFLYPFGMVMGWLLLSALIGDIAAPINRWRFVRSMIIAGLAVVALTSLLYLPVLRSSGLAAITGNRYVSAVEGSAFMENTLAHFRNSWQEWIRDLPAFTGILIVLGLIVSTAFNHRLSSQRVPFLIPAGLWILVTLAIQRVTPWPRVWLFLLPFVFIWASAGLIGLFRLIRVPRIAISQAPADTIFIILVAGLAVLFSLNVYRAQSIGQPGRVYQNATSDEEAIAEYLKGYLQPGDVVATAIPVNYPLRYYFLRNNLPFDYFYKKSDHPAFKRALVVVSRGYDQTLAEVLAFTRLGDQVKDPQTARLVHQYRMTDIYEIAP